MRLLRSILTTPVGEMIALSGDESLAALEFTGKRRHDRLEARLRRWFPPHVIEDGANEVTRIARAWLDDYFAAAPRAGTEPPRPPLPPLAMYGTPFEQRVWEALRRIPAGETSTYGDIARQIGAPGASRAVGLANGANPIAIIVPCHRVIGASGALTGYGGGLDRKRWLLAHERDKYARPLLNA